MALHFLKKCKKPKQMRENRRIKKTQNIYIYIYIYKINIKKRRREIVAKGTVLSKVKETKAI